MSRPENPSARSAGNHAAISPGHRQGVRVGGLVDLVAQRDRLPGPQAKQVSRRQRTDHTAGFIRDAEMADPEAAHSPDGAIDERVGGNRDQRPAS